MDQALISASAIALLNAIKEAMVGNWKPLLWTVAAGVVAVVVTYLVDLNGTNLAHAFVLGLGGSGVYTLATKVSESNG